jgi:hypothetical protein
VQGVQRLATIVAKNRMWATSWPPLKKQARGY